MHRGYSDLQQFFAATEARSHRRVTDGAADADAELGGHQDGVLFGVQAGTQIVAAAARVLLRVVAAVAAPLVTVGRSGGGAVVPGRDDVPVSHQQGAHPVAGAAGTLTNSDGDAEEIFVQTWS